MRRPLVFILMLLAARLGAADGEWVRKVEAVVETKYVRHGIERAGTSLRPEAWLTDEAWKFGAWMNFPLHEGHWHELGLSAGYAHVFEAGPTLGLQVTHFHLGHAYDGHPAHTAELTVSLALPAGPGRAEFSLTRDVNRRADLAELGYEGEIALKSLGAFLNYRLYVGTQEADDVLPSWAMRVADGYTYHGVDLKLPYRVGGQTLMTAGVHYAGTNGARPFWSPDRAAPGTKIWLSLAASYEF